MSWYSGGWGGCGGDGKGGGGYGGQPLTKGNLPSLPNSSIESLPNAGVAVFRDGPTLQIEFCDQLRRAMEPYSAGQCSFENVDVCNVRWSASNFSYLLRALNEKGASTKRLKVYKCFLDDEAIQHLVTWMSSLPAQRLPNEIHLSHNQITMYGLQALLNILESKRAQVASKGPPVWLRIEHNKIEKSVVDNYVAAGQIVYAYKIGASERLTNRTAVAAMPDMFGPPPSVHATPTPSLNNTPSVQWPSVVYPPTVHGLANFAGVTPLPQHQQMFQQRQNQQPQQLVSQTLQTSRSRSPPPSRQPNASTEKLPPGWEKHFSDEYKIFYYWNRETDESVWEPPQE